MDVTDHVGGLVRLGHGVKDGGDVGSDAGDELGVEPSLGLGEDAGADMSGRLEGDDAGDNVKVMSGVSGNGTCQAGSGSDSLGGAADDGAGGARIDLLGGVVNWLEAVIDVLATADPFPGVTGNGGDILAVVERHIVTDAERGSVVEVDNAGTVFAALLVAEDKNSAWLRAFEDAVVTCTLDGGREREERLVE